MALMSNSYVMVQPGLLLVQPKACWGEPSTPLLVGEFTTSKLASVKLYELCCQVTGLLLISVYKVT